MWINLIKSSQVQLTLKPVTVYLENYNFDN